MFDFTFVAAELRRWMRRAAYFSWSVPLFFFKQKDAKVSGISLKFADGFISTTEKFDQKNPSLHLRCCYTLSKLTQHLFEA